MKKVFYLILAVISCVVLTTALTGASSKGEKFSLKLDANERTIEALKNNPVTATSSVFAEETYYYKGANYNQILKSRVLEI